LQAFAKLKRGGTPYGIAPHKPVLLLSLTELVEKGWIADNRFYITPELVGTFLENWRLLVTTPHSANFTQPFYYLQSDRVGGGPFWMLIPQPGCQINAHIKSVHTLKALLAYGTMKVDLFELLLRASDRVVLQQFLLDKYFSDTKAIFLKHKQMGDGFLHQVENYVLNEPEAKLKKISIHTEEEVFVRSGMFKKYIPQVYNDTCAFTGLRLTSPFSRNFIDACHIVPFSVSHDDKVDNGIALCPNMHRAFDRGLLSIGAYLEILVSPHMLENAEHSYSLAKLKSKKVLLPHNRTYWPKPENLEWHREYAFKR